MENEKEKFLVYESIRRSGVTNMFDVTTVCEISGETLDKKDCFYIMDNYSELAKKYLKEEKTND